MAKVLMALHVAKGLAKMPVGPKPSSVCQTSVGPHDSTPGFLGRWRELAHEYSPGEATAILVALVRSKARDHARHQGHDQMAQRTRDGHYLNSLSLTRVERWPLTLEGALVELAKERKARTERVAPAPADEPKYVDVSDWQRVLEEARSR